MQLKAENNIVNDKPENSLINRLTIHPFKEQSRFMFFNEKCGIFY